MAVVHRVNLHMSTLAHLMTKRPNNNRSEMTPQSGKAQCGPAMVDTQDVSNSANSPRRKGPLAALLALFQSRKPPRAIASREPEQLPFGFAREAHSAVLPDSSSRRRSPAVAARRMSLDAGMPATDELRLQHAMAAHMPPGRRLNLTLTNNRFSMVTVRRHPEGYSVRIHRMFLGAEPRVVRSLCRYVVHNDPRASRTLGEFIRKNESVIREQPRRRRNVVLRPRGAVHDLQQIFDRLNRERFEGKLEARITWGARGARGKTVPRSIKLGSFAIDDRTIRINPILDRKGVPEYFVGWIVFHEMLHGKHGAQQQGSRRCYHTPAFVAEEHSYEHFEKAQAWEDTYMHRLLAHS